MGSSGIGLEESQELGLGGLKGDLLRFPPAPRGYVHNPWRIFEDPGKTHVSYLTGAWFACRVVLVSHSNI